MVGTLEIATHDFMDKEFVPCFCGKGFDVDWGRHVDDRRGVDGHES